ncbi:MAG: sugar transferase [Myxococcales bacterium]|nr:sugar transferase [Myxococcales bacterium]
MRYYLGNIYIGRVIAAVLLDTAAFVIAALLVWELFAPPFSGLGFGATCVVGGFACFTLLYYTDAYGLGVLGSGRRTLLSISVAAGVAAVGALTAALAVDFPPGSLETTARFAGFYAPLLLLGRLVFRAISTWSRLTRRVLLIGNSDLSRAIARAVRSRPNLGTQIIGFLSDDLDDQGAWIEGCPVIGRVGELGKLLEKIEIDRIVVASKRRDEHFPAEDLLRQKLLATPIYSGVSFYERVTGRIYLRELRPSYLIFNDGFALGRFSMAVKRALDISAAVFGLIIAAPIIGLAAVAIKLDSPGPVFFGQVRVGRGGVPFRVWKLRSMRDDAEKLTGAVWATGAADDRITRVGRLIRPARIDELPQLWNVLRGSMSLVGPRPERPEFVDMLAERYPYFRARSAVPPGITGWAQIREGYVNDVEDVEQKLALDFYYLKYRSLGMDLLILWKTIKTVVLLRGL